MSAGVGAPDAPRTQGGEAGDEALARALAGYAGWLGHGQARRAPLWVQRLRMNAPEIEQFRAAPTPPVPAYVVRPIVPVPPAEPVALSGAPAPAGPGAAEALRRARAQPHLHAFTHLPETLEPPAPGYLHGVPFAVKDLIGVRGLPRTGGSASGDNVPFAHDAAAVAALKAQGAVVIGLANLHELAFGASSDNPVFGRVVNPLTPERIPGGSSGGSAAAVAAGIVDVALATDTGGSIRIPAACCGVVGFKPSYDAVSREGVIEVAASLDHVGPIGRTVADCARAFAALTGLPAAPLPSADAPLAGLRVARLGGFFAAPLHPQVRAALEATAQALAGDGAQVAEAQLPGAELAPAIQFVTISTEAAAAHAERLHLRGEQLGEDVRVRLEMAHFLPGHWYLKAQRLRRQLADELLALFDRADLLLCPVMRAPAPRVGAASVEIEGHDYPLHTAVSNLTLPFSFSGLPAIALPWGRAPDGAALAVQLVAAPGQDWQLLRLARRLERLAPQAQLSG